MKAKRDWKNSLDTSFEKGIEKGKEKALNKLIKNGMSEEEAKKIFDV